MNDLRFPGQHSGENVIMIIRRHPISMLFYIITVCLVAPAPFIFFAVGSYFLPILFVAPIVDLLIMATIIFYLFLWVFVYVAIIDYYFDTWIITNERILEVDQKRLFNRTVSEMKLIKIQDITSEVPGIIATLIGYGNISLQSAGEMERFEFKQIPHPVETRKVIVDLYNKAIKNIAINGTPAEKDSGGL